MYTRAQKRFTVMMAKAICRSPLFTVNRELPVKDANEDNDSSAWQCCESVNSMFPTSASEPPQFEPDPKREKEKEKEKGEGNTKNEESFMNKENFGKELKVNQGAGSPIPRSVGRPFSRTRPMKHLSATN